MSLMEGGDFICYVCRAKTGDTFQTGSVAEWNEHCSQIDPETRTTHLTEEGANICAKCKEPIEYSGLPFVPYTELKDAQGKVIGRSKDFSGLICEDCQQQLSSQNSTIKKVSAKK